MRKLNNWIKILKTKKDEVDDYLIDQTSMSINKTKMLSLIRLNYFNEFGRTINWRRCLRSSIKVYKPLIRLLVT